MKRFLFYFILECLFFPIHLSFAQTIDSASSTTHYIYSMGLSSGKRTVVNNGSATKVEEFKKVAGDLTFVGLTQMDTLVQRNLGNLPIYTAVLVNDSVVSSSYYEYIIDRRPRTVNYSPEFDSGVRLKRTYAAVLEHPVHKNAFAWPENTASGMVIGSNYELVEEHQIHSETGIPLQTQGRDGKIVCHILDQNNRVIAIANNASHTDIAYYHYQDLWNENFENLVNNTEPRFGNWGMPSAGVFTKSGLNPSKTYVLSLWFSETDNSTVAVTGGNLLETYDLDVSHNYDGKTWRLRYYYLDQLTALAINVSGLVTDMRLHPLGSTMNTFNYDLLGSVRKESDENQSFTFKYYDIYGDLSDVSIYHPDSSPESIYLSATVRGHVNYKLEESYGVAKGIAYNSQGQTLRTVEAVAPHKAKISILDYDEYRRVSKVYLPFVKDSERPVDYYEAYAKLYENPEPFVQFHTDSTLNPRMDSNLYPYAENRYHQTTGELLEQGGAGSYYQLESSSIPYSGHTAKYANRRHTFGNTNYSIKYWRVENGILKPISSYRDPSLTVSVIRDPNWVSGKKYTKEVYKNWSGNVLLEKRFLNDTDSLMTYFVYDKFNRLTHVIPPTVPFSEITETADVFKKYIYRYKYDKYGRMVSKKLPGQGVMHIVYNKSNLPVAVQDSVSRQKGEWLFTKYDVMGRVLTTIQASYGGTASQLQGIYDNAVYHWEEKTNLNSSQYTSRTYPTSGGKALSVNYYDRYGDNLPNDCPWRTPQSDELRLVVGNPVASKVNVIGTNDYLWTSVFYDKLSREGRVVKQNRLNGYDEQTIVYNAAQRPVRNVRKHSTAITTITDTTSYEYDAVHNLIRTWHQLNGQPKQLLLHSVLDDAGKIGHYTVGGASETDYVLKMVPRYDFLGRTKLLEGRYKDNNLAFVQNYSFEDLARNEFSGKVTGHAYAIKRTGGDAKYTGSYNYDPLYRLTYAGNSFGNTDDKSFKEYFRYDKLGNMTHMGRYAKVSGASQQIDSLTYYYDGMRHSRIDDISSSAAPTKAMGFHDLVQQSDEYTYDGNGRAVRDLNKGISLIRYNTIDLPDTVYFSNGNWVAYRYTAAGEMLSKHARIGGQTLDTYYVNGVEYTGLNGSGNIVSQIHASGVRIRPSGSSYGYQYDITDNRGNSLFTLNQILSTGAVDVVQVNSYYAYGSAAPYSEGNFVSGTKNQYLYNGKEFQEETGWYDYHARMYDPVIGRWNVVDPMSESFFGVSPYNYVLNDPINYTDPTGMYPYGPHGNHGAPGLDPDYRLKQIQQEGLRHGIPDWAWDIGGGIQDVLFFEQYGMSRLDAIERQMQYQAWRSTLSELNISWDPSTYYVKSRGIGLENFENGRMIYDFSVVKRNLPSNSELYGQQGGGNWATGTLAFIALDVSIPDPSDAAWPKWAGYGLAAGGAYLYMNGADMAAKMGREIDAIWRRAKGPNGYVYELRVRNAGNYVDVRGNTVSLGAGDIWKYGESTQQTRYSRNELNNMVPGGVDMNRIYHGNQAEIKIFEKYLLYGHFLNHGSLPPGNKIFR